MITRSQARSRQTLDQAAFPRANPPGQVSQLPTLVSQQSSNEGGVRRSQRTVGGGTSTLAGGNERPPATRTCRSDCLSCPALNKNPQVNSFQTGRLYMSDVRPSEIHCKMQNYIYLLSCVSCGVQYVGESITPLHLRVNVHRRGKSGCEIAINHFRNVCPDNNFTVQILEKLPGNGYIDGRIDPDMRQQRLKREDHWIKTLRTVYPYGLNKRTKGMNEILPVGKLFPSLPRFGSRYIGQRPRAGNQAFISVDEFLTRVSLFPVETRGNDTRKLLEGMKLKHLKRLASGALGYLDTNFRQEDERILNLIIDVTHTKTFKNPPLKSQKKAPAFTVPLLFDNKGMDRIRLASILNSDGVKQLLPSLVKKLEPPSIIYKLHDTIRGKIFNYKETVKGIDINDTDTFGTGITSCDCHNSPFTDSQHGHILTGDLRIVDNLKLRKLLSKGPNYREARSINFNKCKRSIIEGLDSYIQQVAAKVSRVEEEDMTTWKDAVMSKVNENISAIRQNVTPQASNPVLRQTDVIEYLQNFHHKFVLVPIDKASNNIAVICKKYYVEVILKEIGVLGQNNETYLLSNKTKDEIIRDNHEYAKRLGLSVSDHDMDLPVMYWTPKMHKTPTSHRFIIASNHCVTKPISKAVSSVFRLIQNQVENYHAASKFDKHYNKFWVIKNCNPVMEVLDGISKKNRAKSICTYDFSTLYTKLPQDKLITQLNKVIDMVFKGGEKTFIHINKFGARWGKRKQGICFSRAQIKIAVAHLVQNCYFQVGNQIRRQAIGIPMGIDPAPFWANLFLYTYEAEYITTLTRTDKAKAAHFHATQRFIDDLCAANDGGAFSQSFEYIYPPELELKVEHTGNHATFLNLEIFIENQKFLYKLYDKRDSFPFHIVRLPNLSSNIPKSIFYSALVGEFLRIARSSSQVDFFVPKAKELIIRMKNQGAKDREASTVLRKMMGRHECFSKFTASPSEIINSLFD